MCIYSTSKLYISQIFLKFLRIDLILQIFFNGLTFLGGRYIVGLERDCRMLSQKENGVLLSVRVSPNAKRSGIEGIWQDTMLKIALRAPAVEGKANEALITFLADLFHIKKRNVVIVRGDTSREKVVLLEECQTESIRCIIAPYCQDKQSE